MAATHSPLPPRRLAREIALQEPDELLDPRRAAAPCGDQCHDMGRLKLETLENPYQASVPDEGGDIPLRAQRDAETGHRPAADHLAVIASQRRSDADRLIALRVARAAPVMPQCHVLLVL